VRAEEPTPVTVEPAAVRLLDWRERLAGDGRVIGFSEAERDGETWVYCDCRSARDCTAPLQHLQQWGMLSAARKGRASLWLEQAE
jgi:hypothetical protein